MPEPRLNILVITTSYPLVKDSYSGIFVKRLIDHFPDDISVTVLTPDSRETNQPSTGVTRFRYAPKSLQTLAHKPGGIPVALRANIFNYMLLPSFLTATFIYACMLGRRHDLIHANWSINGVIAGIAGKLLRKPVLVTLRGEDITRAKSSFLYRFLLNFCLNYLDRVICVSEDMLTGLQRDFPEHSGKLSVITNGVDPILFETPRNYSVREALSCISIGSLIHRKGYDITIRALALAAGKIRFRLLCIGDGPEKQALQTLVKTSGLEDRIIFPGAMSPDQISQELAGADLFILSSRSEGRPNVLVEAMASGLPVIASDISGVSELIDDKVNGFLFESENYSQLAELIVQVASDRAGREKTGINARITAKKIIPTWNTTAAAYCNAYTQIIGNYPA